MSLFTSLTKAVVGVVTLPVAAVAAAERETSTETTND